MNRILLVLSFSLLLASCHMPTCSTCKEPSASSFRKVFGDSIQAVVYRDQPVTAQDEGFLRSLTFEDMNFDLDRIKHQPLNMVKNFNILLPFKEADTCRQLKVDFRFTYDISTKDTLMLDFIAPDSTYKVWVTDTTRGLLSESSGFMSFTTTAKQGADFLKLQVHMSLHSDTIGRVSKVNISSCDVVCAAARH